MERGSVAVRRGIVVAAVAVAALSAGILLRNSSPYELNLRFVNASQLVKGDQVKVGGVPVGSVKRIALAPDGSASVTVAIHASDLIPLHEGTAARVRISSLSSVANRFIAIDPGPNSAPELPSGGVLQGTSTRSQVELDAVLNTLDMQTRAATQRLLAGSAEIYDGSTPGDEANAGLRVLTPALSQLEGVAREVGRDRTALTRFIVSSAAVVSAVAQQDRHLDRGLSAGAAAAKAVADRRLALDGLLAQAPPTLATATGTLRSTSATLKALLPTSRRLRAVSPDVAALTRDAQPLLEDGPAALRDLGSILGPLRSVLRGAPPLSRVAVGSLSALTTAIGDAQPIVDGVLPYLPEVYHGIVSGFGGAQALTYDANGHIAQVAPVAGDISTNGLFNVAGGSLPLSDKHLLARCPGAAFERASDGSSPFLPSAGACDPKENP
jgi:phospholipid/cholesterol/gamma-HCH transport system substrate-binding protein